MKKIVILLAAVAVMALAFSPVSTVFANSGNGFGGNGAGMMGQTNSNTPLNGALHDYMIAAYAEALHLSADEIETRLTDGETLSAIALSTGLTVDEFQSLISDARSSALASAVADGVITQDQADWMSSRMGGANRRAAMGNAGLRGNGAGFRQSATCPYNQPAQ